MMTFDVQCGWKGGVSAVDDGQVYFLGEVLTGENSRKTILPYFQSSDKLLCVGLLFSK